MGGDISTAALTSVHLRFHVFNKTEKVNVTRPDKVRCYCWFSLGRIYIYQNKTSQKNISIKKVPINKK